MISALALLVHVAPADAVCLGRCGGGGLTSATTAAANSAIVSAQQAAAVTQQSMNSLSQATQALQAMQAAQTAAHNLALGSPPNTTAGLPAVTDGLSPGGLIVDPRVATNSNLWVNASLPVQSVSNGLTSVTINQTAPQAVLTWQQFNVGKNTVVDFNQQGNANWIALNRIDASGVPSQILGQIKADGQVMLINPNDIIFSGSSQINVHTLIASAMDISLSSTASSAGPTTYAQVPGAPSGVMAPASETADNAGFMTNGLYPFNTTLVLAASNIPGQTNVGIVVEKGASISTAVSGFDNGGYVALIGPTVTNGGSITTSAGQIILAAGGAVSITEPAANTSQTVFTVLNTSTGNALVANTGLLIAARGNITLMGDEVEQFGVAEATTSITRAGSITSARRRLNPPLRASPRRFSGQAALPPSCRMKMARPSPPIRFPPSSLPRSWSRPSTWTCSPAR